MPTATSQSPTGGARHGRVEREQGADRQKFIHAERRAGQRTRRRRAYRRSRDSRRRSARSKNFPQAELFEAAVAACARAGRATRPISVNVDDPARLRPLGRWFWACRNRHEMAACDPHGMHYMESPRGMAPAARDIQRHRHRRSNPPSPAWPAPRRRSVLATLDTGLPTRPGRRRRLDQSAEQSSACSARPRRAHALARPLPVPNSRPRDHPRGSEP